MVVGIVADGSDFWAIARCKSPVNRAYVCSHTNTRYPRDIVVKIADNPNRYILPEYIHNKYNLEETHSAYVFLLLLFYGGIHR